MSKSNVIKFPEIRRPVVVPHPSSKEMRRLKLMVARAKAGLRRDKCVTFGQFRALVATGNERDA
ncbi:MAG: hypothetical protein J0H39_13790 [Alphaproteobacteria bacterium]|nr:hypothetical protein [Alphaproteobacteria bacterium]